METERQEGQFETEPKSSEGQENLEAGEALGGEWQARLETNPSRETLRLLVEFARGKGWVQKG